MNIAITNKIIGYILLFAGLLLIFVPLYYVFNVLNGQYLPPEIFKASKTEINKNINPIDLQKQVESALLNTLPLDLIYKSLNLIIWSILLAVFIFAGKQVATIGIKLLNSQA